MVKVTMIKRLVHVKMNMSARGFVGGVDPTLQFSRLLRCAGLEECLLDGEHLLRQGDYANSGMRHHG
jgi:hypothetical protein